MEKNFDLALLTFSGFENNKCPSQFYSFDREYNVIFDNKRSLNDDFEGNFVNSGVFADKLASFYSYFFK